MYIVIAAGALQTILSNEGLGFSLRKEKKYTNRTVLPLGVTFWRQFGKSTWYRLFLNRFAEVPEVHCKSPLRGKSSSFS